MTECKTFRDFYEEARKEPTPASAFIAEMAALTGRGENAVRMWVSGRQRPDGLARRVLAERLGVDPDGLFPENAQNKANQNGNGRQN